MPEACLTASSSLANIAARQLQDADAKSLAEIEKLALKAKSAAEQVAKLEREFADVVQTLSPMKKHRLASRSRMRKTGVSNVNTPQSTTRSTMLKSSSTPSVSPRKTPLPTVREGGGPPLRPGRVSPRSATPTRAKLAVVAATISEQPVESPAIPELQLNEKVSRHATAMYMTPRQGLDGNQQFTQCIMDLKEAAAVRVRFKTTIAKERSGIHLVKNSILVKNALLHEIHSYVRRHPASTSTMHGNQIIAAASKLETFKTAKLMEMDSAQMEAQQNSVSRQRSLTKGIHQPYPHFPSKGGKSKGVVHYTNQLARRVGWLERQKANALKASEKSDADHAATMRGLCRTSFVKDANTFEVRTIEPREYQPPGQVDITDNTKVEYQHVMALKDRIVQIQRQWRAALIRKHFKKQRECAILIQRWWRFEQGHEPTEARRTVRKLMLLAHTTFRIIGRPLPESAQRLLEPIQAARYARLAAERRFIPDRHKKLTRREAELLKRETEFDANDRARCQALLTVAAGADTGTESIDEQLATKFKRILRSHPGGGRDTLFEASNVLFTAKTPTDLGVAINSGSVMTVASVLTKEDVY